MVTADEVIEGVTSRSKTLDTAWSWITTVDHKRIGILYMVTAIIFFFGAGIEALVMRTQLARPDSTLVEAETFNQMFTMHALSMIFLGVMPMSVAFFNLIVPLAIGARDVAFPRLNALSYWIFLFGGLLLNGGFISGMGSPDAGWFAYANLTEEPFSKGQGMSFYALGLITLGVSSLAGAFNFLVTIINMRAPGMTLMRMPPFIWMTLVTSFLLVTAMPVITVGLIQILFDRNFGTNFFDTTAGGSPVLWQHVFWLFGHPEVYILILPAMGIVSEIIPTFSRKPLFGYHFVIFSGIVIGFMGWGVWSHHMFTVGLGNIANSVFAITTMLIAIPTGVKIFNWLGTMWGGSIRFSTPMLFALGFVAMFILGGLSGVTHASPPADAQQQDSYYIVAHLHYVLFGGSIMGLLAGIYYWFPKVTGRMLNDNLGKLHFWLVMFGSNLTFFPMHILGLVGMPRRVYTYSATSGFEAYNLLQTVGAFILAASFLIFLHNVFSSLRKGARAGKDPWDGRTLEWTIPSPPPHYNFVTIPEIHSREPAWDMKYGHDSEGAMPIERPDAPGAQLYNEAEEEDHPEIHMPSPSYWPIVVAAGFGIAGALFIVGPWYSSIGLVIAMIGLYSWAAEPVSKDEHH